MEKQRTMPVDYGIEAGRQLVYSGGSTTNTYVEPLAKTESFARNAMAVGQANAISPISLNVTGFEPGQTFSSSERERPLFNDCVNVKLRAFMYPYTLTSTTARRPTTVSVVPYSARPMINATASRDFVLMGQNVAASLWSLADAASARAWWNMKPRFEGRISMLNFLFELKDFRDIAKHVMRIDFRNLASEARSLRSFIERTKTEMGLAGEVKIGDVPNIVRGLDTSTRGLAALYLTNEFAVKPTYRDVVTILLQAQKTAVDAQKAFEQKGHEQQTRHASEMLFNDVSNVYIPTYEPQFEFKMEHKARFTATMNYMYSYRKRPAIAAARRYWGLDLNAEVVWNALPLSFILDYVIDIASAIHAMSTDPNVSLQTLQYCESILYQRVAGWFTRKDPLTCWHAINGQFFAHGANLPLTGFEFSQYERRAGSPNRGPALPKVSWPSSGQARNLLALIRCWV